MNNQQDGFRSSLKNTLDFFSAELWRRKKMVAVFVAATIAASLIQFIGPYFTQKLIDIAIPAKDPWLIGRYAAFIVSSIVLSYFVSILYVRFAVKIYVEIQAAIRDRIIDSLLAKEPDFFRNYSAGDIMTRLSADLNWVGEFFYNIFIYAFFIYVTAALAYIAWLFYMSWILALISVTFFVLSMSISLIYYRPIMRRFLIAQTLYSEVNDIALDMVSGERDIRLHQQEERFRRYFSSANKAYADAQFSAVVLKDSVWNTFVHLLRLNAALPLLIGAFMIYLDIGNITIGLLVAFVQVMMGASEYIRSISYALVDGSSVSAYIGRINELIKSRSSKNDAPSHIEVTPESYAVEFCNVAYSYPSGRKIFSNLNLKIDSAERIAIMAPSGFGKTTLANLLLRLYKPDSGTILFGGKDIRLYPNNFYLSYFAYVGPQTHIFKMSIRENIELGWAATSEAHLKEIIKTLRLDKLIDELPQGAETVLNKEGMALSEGQKQRIALGRALIREPQVLVLDEFSAALDKQTEKEILDDLLQLAGNQTIICITHSPSVAGRMDKVVSLADISG